MNNTLLLKKQVSIVLLLLCAINTSYAQVLSDFNPRYTNENIRGNITMAANDIVGVLYNTVTSTDFDPNAAYNIANDFNGNKFTAYIDIDNDPTTFSSSSADLVVPRTDCSRIVYAGLYWSANYYMARTNQIISWPENHIPSTRQTNVRLNIDNSPLAFSYLARPSEFDNDVSDIRLSPVSSYLVIAEPETGCGITNGAALDGNIAVVRNTGGCSMREKVVNAQNAGAVGVVIVDTTPDMPKLVGNGPTITIPSVSIGNDDINNFVLTGEDLINALRAESNVVIATLSTDGNDENFNLPFTDPRRQGPANFENIKFKVPNGSYVDIAAQSIIWDGYRNTPTNNNTVANDEVQYVCYSDVTALIDPNNPFGTYTVANMNATQAFTSTADGACGGWILVVAYEDPQESSKYISMQDGYVQIRASDPPLDFNFSGFRTLQGNQPVEVVFSTAGLEGDRAFTGDQLLIETPPVGSGNFTPLGSGTSVIDDVNPTTNFFNSSISINNNYTTNRVPASENTLGFDADLFSLPNAGNNLIGNNQTSANFRLSTAGDRYGVFFGAFSVTVIEPELQIIKRVYALDGITEITGNNVELGDEVFYDLEIENIGNEDFVDGTVLITDVLPANMDFVGDITMSPGISLISDPTSNTLVFSISSSAVETPNDQPVGVGDGPIFIRFRAGLVSTCEELRDACSNIITNTASATYTGLVSGTASGTLSTAELGSCGEDLGEVSNVLVNVPACRQEVTACDDDIVLAAGTGYDQYTWSGPGIAPPIVQTGPTAHLLNIPNVQSGVYSVIKEDIAGSNCMTLTEEFNVQAFREIRNPILDLVNNTSIISTSCSGLDIPQILLCGTQTEFLQTGFDPSGITSISWQRLAPSGSCMVDPNDPCSLLDGNCTDTNWVEEINGNTQNFTVSTAGDYRIMVEFSGGCTIPFYFSAFRNDYQPTLSMNPIECGNDGSVTVTNVPANFAFSLTSGGPYTNTAGVFPISTPGDVTVYGIDTAFTGCEYTATINVPIYNPTFEVTTVDPTCINNDTGTGGGIITISVTGGIPEYQYTISSPALGAVSPIIVPNSSANNGNYSELNLPPGDYTVEVISNRPTPECIDSFNVTINPAPDFDAEVVLIAPETCDRGALVEVNVRNGSGNYAYDNGNGNFVSCNIFEIPSPADPSQTYTFRVSDQNIPSGTAACIISASIDNISPYTPTVIDAITIIDPPCPGDSGQLQVAVNPSVAGRVYTYQLWDCAADLNCGDPANWDPTLWTLVDEIPSATSQNVTFVNVAEGSDYVVSVQHNNTTPTISNPTCTFPTPAPTICPVRQRVGAISSPSNITAVVPATPQRPLSCIPGQENALLEVTSITGGSGAYEWSTDNSFFQNVTTTPFTVDAPAAGTYTIYIRNQGTSDCAVSYEVTVADLQNITDIVFTPGDTNCTTGTSEVSFEATPPITAAGVTYQYQVTPDPTSGTGTTGFQVTNSYTVSADVVYTIIARRSDEQCEFTDQYTIASIPPIAITSAVEAAPAVCVGDANGALTFTVTNSTSFDYTISVGGSIVNSGNGVTTNNVDINGLAAGNYTITVTDTNPGGSGSPRNCSDTRTVIITEPTAPLAITVATFDSNCAVNSGTITATATGGRGNYQYQLVNSAGTIEVPYPNTTGIFPGLATGDYTVFVRDGNSAAACETSRPARINQLASPTIALANGGDPCYDGVDQASQRITITPGVPSPIGPFEYSLNGGTATAVTFLGAPAPANTFEIPNLIPNTYTVIVTNTATNCATTSLSFTINPELTISASLVNDITCTEPANLSFTAAGGSTTYTGFAVYDYNAGSPTLNTATTDSNTAHALNTPGEYVIQVTDDQGCTAFSNPITVTSYETMVASAPVITNPNCAGENGTIAISLTAGEGPFTYTLDNDPTTTQGPTGTGPVTFINVPVGPHTITITDGTGNTPPCTIDVPAEIIAPTPITASIAQTQEYRCDVAGSSTTPQLGEISVTSPANGTPPYAYSIDGIDYSNTTGIFANLTDGIYTLYIRDANTTACPVELGDITIAPLVQVTDLSFITTQIQCPGLTSNVTVSATLDGTSGVTYQITAPTTINPQPAPNENRFDGLTSGTTYTFEATTATHGCVYTETFTVPLIDFIAVNGTVVNEPTCNGQSTGEIGFTVSGIDLTTTTYAYEVRLGSATGTIVANNTGQNTPTITTTDILAAGTYTIIVTDETTNCSDDTEVILGEPAVLTIGATTNPDLTCVQNATITVTTATGGNGGYQYELLDNGGTVIAGPQSSTVFSVSVAGVYTINATDALGCTATTTATVTTPPAVTAIIETTSDLCFDTTDQASLDITINTGVGPFTYAVNGGANMTVTGTAFTMSGLTPDAYSILITDANGCTITLNQTIQPQITLTASLLKDLDCSASPEGQIQVTSTGGNGTNTFELDINGSGYAPYTGAFPYIAATAGTYQFRVRDVAGCQAETAPITVTPAPNPQVNPPTITNPRCNGGVDGSVTININTAIGTGPYQVDFNGAGFSNQLTYGGLAENTYNYTVRDAKGCEESFSVTLSAPPVIIDSIDRRNISCTGGIFTQGRFEFQMITGGVPPYDITLLNTADLSLATTSSTNPVAGVAAGATISFDDLAFGNYTLRVVDANGCTYSFFESISTTPIFQINSYVVTSCSAGLELNIGIVTGTGNPPFRIREYFPGTTAPYVPFSSPGTNSHVITGLPFDTPFTFEVIDANDCTDIQTIIPQPSPGTIAIAATPTPITCVGANDGSIDYSVTGYQGTELTYSIFRSDNLVTPITASYTFSATNPQTVAAGGTATGTVSGFGPGTYLIRVNETDGALGANQCNAAIEFTIQEAPTPFTYDSTTIIDGNCNAASQGIVAVSGGQTPYLFAVVQDGAAAPSSGAYNASNVVVLDQTITTDWDLYTQDAFGCVLGPIDLTAAVIPNPTIDAISAVVDSCIFDGSFEFTVTATSQSIPDFGIDDGDTSTSDAIVFATGTATANPNEYEYTYTVSGPSVDAYTITLRDQNGCIDTDSVTIYPELIVDANFTVDPTCFNANSGTVTATVTGGSDISANWTVVLIDTDTSLAAGTGPAFTAPNSYEFTNVPTGNYEVQVIDSATGCPAAVDAVQRAPLVTPVITVAIDEISCIGATDGAITVSIQPGTDGFGPYTYELLENNGGTAGALIATQVDNPLFTGLSFDALAAPFPTAGEYLVRVRSVLGCEASSPATLVNPTLATVNPLTVTPYTCTGTTVNTPVITVDGFTGGTPPYTISYVDPSGNTVGPVAPASLDTDMATAGIQIIANEAGNYTFTIFDANNCPNLLAAFPVPAFPIMTDAIVNQVTGIDCNTNTEEVTVTVAGGTGTYDFVEANGLVPPQNGIASTTSNPFFLPGVGNYTFNVVDATTGCTIQTLPYDVAPYDTITAAIAVVAPDDIECFNDATARVALTVTGHTGLYNYTATNTTTGATINGTGDTTVQNPLEIVGFQAGTIEVAITDPVSACTDTSNSVVIGQPTQVMLALNSTVNANCTDDAQIRVVATGGTPPYTFTAINAPATVAFLETNNTGIFDVPVPNTPSATADYQITVSDANSCTLPALDVTVNRTDNPVLAPLAVDDVCTHDGSYVITATATSNVPAPGTGTLRFQLGTGDIEDANNGSTSHTFTVATTGIYTVTAYDENGCPSNVESITILPALLATADFTADPTCRDADGTITVNVSGGSDFSANAANFSFILNGTDSTGSPVNINQTGAGGNIFTSVSAGNYTVSIVDVNLPAVTTTPCALTIAVPQLSIPVDPIPSAVPTPVSCIGATDGTIDVSLQAGTDIDGPYTYELFVDNLGTPGAAVGAPQLENSLFTNLSMGDYIVVVTSDRNCAAQLPVSVPDATQVAVTTAQSAYGCAPDNSSIFPIITVTITDGIPPYSISYVTPSGTTITEPTIVDADTVTAGVQYEIVADQELDYAITVTDANSCNTVPSVIVESVLPFPIMTNPTAVVSMGGDITCTSDEMVDVTVQGGSGDFLFEVISGPSGSILPSAIDPAAGLNTAQFAMPRTLGIYTIRITDQGTNCTITVNHEIDEFDTIAIVATEQTPVSCLGDADGTISLAVTGYTGSYNFEIFNLDGSSAGFTGTATATNTSPSVLPISLPQGIYIVEVREAVTPFCTERSNVVAVTGPGSALVTSVSIINEIESCDPRSDGAIQASVTGAQGIVNYTLTPGGTTNDTGLFENLTAGTYTVTAVDMQGCSDDEMFEILSPTPMTIAAIPTSSVSCFGSTDGRIVVNATGGQGPGTYLYTLTFPDGVTTSGPQTINEFTNLGPGDYRVTVSDNLNCSEFIDTTIIEPSEVTVTIDSVTQVACNLDTIDVVISGTSDVAISLYYVVDQDGNETSSTSTNFTALGAGTYQFFVEDVNGCRSDLSIPVPVLPISNISIALDVSAANVNCFNESSGIISATVSGGVGSYNFELANTTTGDTWTAQPENEFRDLPPGAYVYTVTSGGNCTSTANFTITNPAEFTPTSDVSNVSCNGEDNGSIRILASGGTPPYSFAISSNPGVFFNDASDNIPNEHIFDRLAPGSYDVLAQDANGCDVVFPITITEPPILSANIVGAVTPETCAGDSDGAATIEISGGTGPYSTNITNNDADFVEGQFSFTGLPGGVTTVFIIDSSGCRISLPIEIPEGVVLVATMQERFECPIWDLTDPKTPIIIQDPRYYVDFELGPESENTNLEFVLTPVDGAPTPIPQLTQGQFEVFAPGTYQGMVRYIPTGCEFNAGTITVEEYTPRPLPIAQMTNNPRDPNEYEIFVGTEGYNNEYVYSVAMLQEGQTFASLTPADYTTLATNIFTIEATASYAIQVIDTRASNRECEVNRVQDLEFINIMIPNYFTPNDGSTGWYPRQDPFKQPFFFGNMEVKVFDRHGRLLAEFLGDQGTNGGWKGIYQGKDLPSGDYWYMIVMNDVHNRKFTGHFTLYR